jgi:hypothetical protein
VFYCVLAERLAGDLGQQRTQVDVGGVDERAQDDADDDGADSQGVLLDGHALDGREAGEQVGDGLAAAIALGLDVNVDRGLLLVVDLARLVLVGRSHDTVLSLRCHFALLFFFSVSKTGQ